MRLLLSILLLASLQSFAQSRPLLIRPNPGGVTYTKSFQKIQDSTSYEAFGFIERTGADELTYYVRAGSAHLTDGKGTRRRYTISTGQWEASPTVFITDTSDVRDLWGGLLDDDSVIIFTMASKNNIGGTWASDDVYFLKGKNNNFTPKRSIYSMPNIPRLQRNYTFGKVCNDPYNPGTSYMMYACYNVDTGSTSSQKLNVLKTTDYWQTWTSLNVYTGTLLFTETTIVKGGGDSLLVIARIETGAPLRQFESANGGATWTFRNATNLGYTSSYVAVPFMRKNNSGLIDVMYQDRNTGWLTISKDNVLANVFGHPASWNTPELYYYNRFGTNASETYKLGYSSMVEINTGDYFTVVSKQESQAKANLWYSRHKPYSADPGGLPDAPPNLSVSNLTSSVATVSADMEAQTVGGYTQAQAENIRYFECDLSTSPDFSSFVTTKVINSNTTGITTEVNQFRNPSHYLSMYTLTSGTTYYFRMRAVNNNGVSAWTSTSFTTL